MLVTFSESLVVVLEWVRRMLEQPAVDQECSVPAYCSLQVEAHVYDHRFYDMVHFSHNHGG